MGHVAAGDFCKVALGWWLCRVGAVSGHNSTLIIEFVRLP